jgi:hypothetical protein
MPSHDEERVSRRALLQGAAAAGAAGLAVTAIGAPALAAARPRPEPEPGSSVLGTAAGPIVVHVRNAASGDIEVFAGTSQARLRDKDLAARIARAVPGRS